MTDPVHGDIYLTHLEVVIVDSSPFQRLRRIRQLGTVPLVYPGATHSRFSHSLGALRVVQDIFDIVLSQGNSPHAAPDLFGQWRDNHDNPDDFWRLVGEAVVLGRLGALLHDLGHIPFSHTIEDDLGLLRPHDENEGRYEYYFKRLGDSLAPAKRIALHEALEREGLAAALRPLILSGNTGLEEDGKPAAAHDALRLLGKQRVNGTGSGYPFVADMVGNTICADLLDYLRRDHLYTGLPAALGHRFMSGFYVVRAGDSHTETETGAEITNVHYPERMALRIDRDKRERKDIISELLKHLRFRYELQERVYSHHAKTAADAILGKALVLYYDAAWMEIAGTIGGAETAQVLEGGPGVSQADVADALVKDKGPEALAVVDGKAGQRLEHRLRWIGDDGLLEILAGLTDPPDDDDSDGDEGPDAPGGRFNGRNDIGPEPPPDHDAIQAAGWRCRTLANELLTRRLYKRAGQTVGASARKKLHKLFSDRDKRRELERDAAQYAEVDESQVVIWVPEPRMRLKVAEVLVDYGAGIAPFEEYSPRGAEIYNDHRALWAITVFVHPSLHHAPAERWILARLAQTMGVHWDRHRPPMAETPAQWPLAEAARTHAEAAKDKVSEDEQRAVIGGVKTDVHYRAEDTTFGQTMKRYRGELTSYRKRPKNEDD